MHDLWQSSSVFSRRNLVKRKHLLLLSLLIGTMLLLGGCGVGQNAVDVTTTAPDGFWQTLVVWPLAKALIWLNDILVNLNVPYSWGFAIILFTLGIKLITFPLTMSQIRGMEAQKALQPKIQELQKKYGKDREKLSQEQMKLYQEAGVNPLSGCLPLLVQMPVLFGLYSALVVLGPQLDNARFFWIPDLGFPHYTAGMSWIPELFNSGQYLLLLAYLVLPALLMVTQVLTQKYMTPATPAGSDGQAGMMRQMTTIMTLMFGFFTLQVPAGLTLYWVTSNVLQIVQQLAITRLQPATTAVGSAAPIKVNEPASVQTKPSSNGTSSDDKVISNGTAGDSQSRSRRSRRQRKRK
jgi:YidC/Oxa1 family membrane protein insertase